MYLVIAEKPSVSKAIAEVIGASKKEEGYLEGKAKMAIPYYWVDLALERLTLSYNERLRAENTG